MSRAVLCQSVAVVSGLLLMPACSTIAPPSITRSDIYEFRSIQGIDTLTFHWPRGTLPVRIWLEPGSELQASLDSAITRWEAAFLYGEFRATQVADSASADIIVRASALEEGGSSLREAYHRRAHDCNGETDLDVDVAAHTLTLPVHIAVYSIVSQPPPDIGRCFSITMTHELGHAIGILAHSPYAEDVMASNSDVDGLSERDRLTAVFLYRTQPTLTLIDRNP